MDVTIVGLAGEAGSGKSSVADTLARLGFHRYSLAYPLRELCRSMFAWRPTEPDQVQFCWPAVADGTPLFRGLDPSQDHFGKLKREPFAEPWQVDAQVASYAVTALERWVKRELDRDIVEQGPSGLIFLKLCGKTFGSPREILQFVGTDLCRDHLGRSFWLDVAERRIEGWSRGSSSGRRLLDSGDQRPYTPQLVVIDDLRFENEVQWVKENGSPDNLVLRLRCPNAPAEPGIDQHRSEASLPPDELFDAVFERPFGALDELRRDVVRVVTEWLGFGVHPKLGHVWPEDPA